MRNINTYIFEKLRLNKDTNVSSNVQLLLEFFKKIDNKVNTTKVLDAYFITFGITNFDLYFPANEQLNAFIDNCKDFNIKFDDVNFISADDFVENLESQILDEEINLDNAINIEKKYIYYQNGEKNDAWIKIYKGKYPEKGIMIECYKYYIILMAK